MTYFAYDIQPPSTNIANKMRDLNINIYSFFYHKFKYDYFHPLETLEFVGRGRPINIDSN